MFVQGLETAVRVDTRRAAQAGSTWRDILKTLTGMWAVLRGREARRNKPHSGDYISLAVVAIGKSHCLYLQNQSQISSAPPAPWSKQWPWGPVGAVGAISSLLLLCVHPPPHLVHTQGSRLAPLPCGCASHGNET